MNDAGRPGPVLVTGGAGFIGSHLVERLVASRVPVRVLDDFSTGRLEHLATVARAVEIERADVTDPAAVRRACTGVRAVVHLAALTSVPGSLADPERCDLINRRASAELFDEAFLTAGCERVVFASSCAVYGAGVPAPVAESDRGEIQSPYAQSKRAVEDLAIERWTRRRQAVVSLRLFNVYGPRQDPDGPYAAVVPAFLRAARRRVAATVHGDGLQTRDFVYVEDVVAAILAALVAPVERVGGQVFNVGSGQATSLLELLATIRQFAPDTPPPRHEARRPGDLRDSVADPRRASETLGFTASVPLAEGLRRTWEAIGDD